MTDAGRPDGLFHTLARLLFLAAGLLVVLWFVFAVQRVLLLFALALVLASVLNVPVTWLERKGVSRGVGTMLVAALLAAFAAGLLWLLAPRIVRDVPRLIDTLPEIAQTIADRVVAFFGEHPEVERQFSRLIDWMVDSLTTMWQHADQLLQAVVLTLFLVALVLYLVSNPRPLLETYLRAVPPEHRPSAARALTRSAVMVVGWVWSNLILGSIKAVASFIFLSLLEVPGAPVWALLALFAGLIPRIGFYLMAIPPVLVAIVADPTSALWVALFYWALSEFLGNFVAPKVQGELMQLHPVFVLFMTLAMAYAFGVIGVILAPPVAGFLKIYVEEFYLNHRPAVADLHARVRAMMERDVAAAGSLTVAADREPDGGPP